jgi:hypothetical protein
MFIRRDLVEEFKDNHDITSDGDALVILAALALILLRTDASQVAGIVEKLKKQLEEDNE